MPLASPPLTTTLHLSPKRKRSDTDTPPTAPPTSRLRTTLSPPPPLLPRNYDKEQGSPRTAVAGHLQNLDLSDLKDLKDLTDFTPLDLRNKTPNLRFGSPNFAARKPLTPPREEELEVPETPRLKPVVIGGVVEGTDLEGKKGKGEGEKLWWSEAEITGHDPQDPLDDGEGINGVGFLPTPAIAHARAERRKRQVKDWKEREAREARQRRSDRRRRREREDGGGGVGTVGAVGAVNGVGGNRTTRDQGWARGMGTEGVGGVGVGGAGEVRKVRFLEA